MTRALLLALAFYIGGSVHFAWAGDIGSGSFVGSGSGSGRGSYLVVAVPAAPPVAEYVEVEADYVSLPLNVRSANDDAMARMKDVEATLASLRKEAEAFPDIVVTSGTVSITPANEKVTWGSSSGYKHRTESSLYMSAPLTQGTSVFSVSERIYALLARVKPVGEAKVSVGTTALSVREPERFRDDLLHRIRDSVAKAKKELGATGPVDVSGLAGPVLVSQKDDRTVRVFLDYELSVHY